MPAHLDDTTAVHTSLIPHQARHHISHRDQPSWLAREAARLRAELDKHRSAKSLPAWRAIAYEAAAIAGGVLFVVVGVVLLISLADYLFR